MLILSLSVSGSSNNNKPLTYTELLEMIQNDEIASIATVDGTVVVYGVKTDSKFLERFPDKYDFIASIPSVDIFYEDVNGLKAIGAIKRAPERSPSVFHTFYRGLHGISYGSATSAV